MWQPTPESERSRLLDVLRGLALFGVLAMNLMSSFRISFFDYMEGRRATGGITGEVIDQVLDVLVESKAMILFAFLFGAGAAIQAERAERHGGRIRPFLYRRYCVLLLFGAAHVVLLWNGDILCLYAVCGLLLVPLFSAPIRLIASTGVLLVVMPYLVPLPIPFPNSEQMRTHAAQATQVYAMGSFAEIFAFRLLEFRKFLLPLLLGVFSQTVGLMLIGSAAWRSGILNHPEQHRQTLRNILMVSATIAVASHLADPMPRLKAILPEVLRDLGTTFLTASAYAAAALLWLTPGRIDRLTGVAAIGRMALTNYLTQSLVMSGIFYGFGVGLFGKLKPAPAMMIVVAIYAVQIAASRLWLRRFRFGPVEWLWRSLSYGRLQPIRNTSKGLGDPRGAI